MASTESGLARRTAAGALVEVILVALAYVAGASIGLSLAVANDNVTAIWPPTAIAVSALLLRGRHVWPGVAVGALVANVLNGLPVPLAAGIAVGNTLGPLTAIWILRRLDLRPTLERVRDAVVLVIGGAAVPMLLSATVGTAVLMVGGQLTSATALDAWWLWWVGDTMGVVVFAPVLLTFGSIKPAQSLILREPWRAIASIAIVIAVAAFVLRTGQPIRFVVLPVALWIAMRYEQQGAAVCTALLSTIAIWNVGRMAPTDVDLMMTQGLNATVAVTLLCFAGVMTERRRAQDELRDAAVALEERVRERTADLVTSQDRLAQAQRLAHIGSFQWDARTDSNIWSEELLKIYGLPAGSGAPGMEDYLSFIDPSARESVRTAVADAIATGTPLGHEYPVILRDGTRKWVHAYVEVIQDEDGELAGLRGTCQDITERKRAEDALRSGEEKLRVLLSSAPDAMVVADQDGTIVLVNDQLTNLLGYEPEEVIGRSVEILLPDELRALHVDHREKYLTNPRRRPMGAGIDLSARTRDGELVPVDVSLSPVSTEEGVVVFASIRDATERRRAEAALRTALEREQEASEHLRKLDAAKNAFLSAVSHELRTPLTTILGFTELLQDPELDEQTKTELLQRVDANAQRLERLLSDLLDLDRLQRGIIDPRRQRVNLSDLTDRALASMQLRDHPLTVDVDTTIAWIDPAQTERILENLVSNAVRYTPPQTPIRLIARATSDGGVAINVVDEGPGIPDDRKASIFEPFVRLGGGSFTQGTGIGLALVDRFARLHGGRAWVEDRPGGGASFHVVLAGPVGPGAVSDVA